MPVSVETALALLFPNTEPGLQHINFFVRLAVAAGKQYLTDNNITNICFATTTAEIGVNYRQAQRSGGILIITTQAFVSRRACALVFLNFKQRLFEIVDVRDVTFDESIRDNMLTELWQELNQQEYARVANFPTRVINDLQYAVYNDDFAEQIDPNKELYLLWFAFRRCQWSPSVSTEDMRRNLCASSPLNGADLIQCCVYVVTTHANFTCSTTECIETATNLQFNNAGDIAFIKAALTNPKTIAKGTLQGYNAFVDRAKTTTTAGIYYAVAQPNENVFVAIKCCAKVVGVRLGLTSAAQRAIPLHSSIVIDSDFRPVTTASMQSETTLTVRGFGGACGNYSIQFTACLALLVEMPEKPYIQLAPSCPIHVFPIMQPFNVHDQKYLPLTPYLYKLFPRGATEHQPFPVDYDTYKSSPAVVVGNYGKLCKTFHTDCAAGDSVSRDKFTWTIPDKDGKCVVSFNTASTTYFIHELSGRDAAEIYGEFIKCSQPHVLSIHYTAVAPSPYATLFPTQYPDRLFPSNRSFLLDETTRTDTATLYIVFLNKCVAVTLTNGNVDQICELDIVPAQWVVNKNEYHVYSTTGMLFGVAADTITLRYTNQNILSGLFAVLQRYRIDWASLQCGSDWYVKHCTRLFLEESDGWYRWYRTWGEQQVVEVSTPTVFAQFTLVKDAGKRFDLQLASVPIPQSEDLPPAAGVYVRLFGIVHNQPSLLLSKLYMQTNRTITEWTWTVDKRPIFAAAMVLAAWRTTGCVTSGRCTISTSTRTHLDIANAAAHVLTPHGVHLTVQWTGT